jgi:DNA invertase Pin-like site-specific DNA recombinase
MADISRQLQEGAVIMAAPSTGTTKTTIRPTDGAQDTPRYDLPPSAMHRQRAAARLASIPGACPPGFYAGRQAERWPGRAFLLGPAMRPVSERLGTPGCVGYARTSTLDQQAGLQAQVRDLEAAGCERTFQEHVSSVSAARPKLEEALRFVREGDVLIATKPDRLARSTRQLLDLVEDLDRRKVSLILLSMGGERIDSRSPTGKLMLTVLGAMAEFERNMMLERQREGIAKAKAEGKYAGRQPTARAKAADILRMAGEGKTRERIAVDLEISLASVYRVLADARETG